MPTGFWWNEAGLTSKYNDQGIQWCDDCPCDIVPILLDCNLILGGSGGETCLPQLPSVLSAMISHDQGASHCIDEQTVTLTPTSANEVSSLWSSGPLSCSEAVDGYLHFLVRPLTGACTNDTDVEFSEVCTVTVGFSRQSDDISVEYYSLCPNAGYTVWQNVQHSLFAYTNRGAVTNPPECSPFFAEFSNVGNSETFGTPACCNSESGGGTYNIIVIEG